MNSSLPRRARLSWQWLWPLALFGVAWAVRWWQLPDQLFFGFEQGRDALISTAIARGEDVVLVGPKTDIGGVFHGAWYYYLMAFPYGLSKGNPLVASAFLVTLISLVPVCMWAWARQVFKSNWWAVIAGVLTIMSYETIHYGRWLSNVTPALLGYVLVMWSAWQYQQSKQARWFVIFASLAGLTAQFEIIATLWFLVLGVGLTIVGWWPRPSIKIWFLAGLAAAFWYLPMVLFNLRNEWISWHSALAYVQESSAHPTAATTSISNGLIGYGRQLVRLSHRNLVGVADWRWWGVLVVLVTGVGLAFKSKTDRAMLQLAIAWLLMTLPVIFFARSLDLPQLYVGTGLSLIWLMVLALRAWWQPMWGKVVALAAMGMIMTSWGPLLTNLQLNQDVFYRTIQDDLNYRDQVALLRFMHEDAAGQPYRWQAFSIPYFQTEGWRYLHRYHYPQVGDQGARFIYVIIEKPVEAFWVKKWTEELGATKLVDTYYFGLLTLEKRQLL